MTNSERFHATFNADPSVDRCPIIEWASWWDKTIEAWEQNGLQPGLSTQELYQHFGLDSNTQFWFPHRTEDCPKPEKHGAPRITDKQNYKELKPFLFPKNAVQSMIREIEEVLPRYNDGSSIIWYTLEGFFWYPRELFGIEPHFYSFYDFPGLYHRICEDLLEWQLGVVEEFSRYMKADFMTIAEDMSYNLGPMLSEESFEEFVSPYYKRLIPEIKKHGTRVIIDSDGDVSSMIPWLIRAGVEGILPLERQAGVDLKVLQQEYPDFFWLGGFDKMCLLQDQGAIDAEFDRIVPMLRKGRFIPSVDHQTPPGVSDEYIYSLVHAQELCEELPITSSLTAICHGNDVAVRLDVNEDGSHNQLIVDFGDIYVGALEFTLNAPSGTVLDLYGFENFYENEIDFTVGLNNSIRYICQEGVQTYRSMSRIGCRYLVLTFSDQSRPVEISGLTFHHSTYPPSGLGSFRCNDNTLNRIWEMCRQTHICCMEETFTDSPTYEQAYWIGDALISAYINAWLFGEYPLMRYCLTLASNGFYTTPLLNALLPTDWNTSIPMWSMNWLLAIEQYIEVSGDKEVLDELYPAMIRLMDTFEDFVTPQGGFLINAWNMLDWAALDIYNHCIVSGQQAILVHCFRFCAAYAADREDHERAKKYTQTSQKLREYIDTVLWDEKQQVFLDGWSPEHGLSKTHSVQTHSLMIIYDAIIDPSKKKRALDIIDNPREDTIQVGSPFFLFYIYELWAKRDLSKVLEDIRERWQGMMRYNCTTCWEVFPGFYEVGRTRSYCHSWSASPVYFFGKYVLGIHPREQAFQRVEILLPEVDMEWCEGSVPTPYGAIRVSWSREDNLRICQVVAPKAITVDTPADTDWDIRVTYFDA